MCPTIGLPIRWRHLVHEVTGIAHWACPPRAFAELPKCTIVLSLFSHSADLRESGPRSQATERKQRYPRSVEHAVAMGRDFVKRDDPPVLLRRFAESGGLAYKIAIIISFSMMWKDGDALCWAG